MRKIFKSLLCLTLSLFIFISFSCSTEKKPKEKVYPESEEPIEHEIYSPDYNSLCQYDQIGYNIISQLSLIDFKSTYVNPESSSCISKIYGGGFIEALSGEYSMNQTRTKYGVMNADIGVLGSFNNKLYCFFGDTVIDAYNTFPCYSNTMGVITDFDYRDGIEMEYYSSYGGGVCTAVLQSTGKIKRDDGLEYTEDTKIPCGSVQIGDTFYMAYMSIDWIPDGVDNWITNTCGLVKTKDAQNWESVDNYVTPYGSNFVENYYVNNVSNDGYVYCFGTAAGRVEGLSIARCKPNDFEDFSKYEFLTSYNNCTPVWSKTNNNFEVIQESVWEHSVMYNEYLGEWLITYTTNANGTYIYTSKNIYGPYELTGRIYRPGQAINVGWYCAYTHPLLTRLNGKKMALLISFMGSGYTYDEEDNEKLESVWDVCIYEICFDKKNKV